MTPKRFQHLLDAYGADLECWPEAERHAGHAVLASSPEAAEARRVAARLDSALLQVGSDVSPASVERVLATVQQPPMPPTVAIPAAVAKAHAGRRWAPTALLGGMAALAFLAGLADGANETAASLPVELFGSVFTSDPAAGSACEFGVASAVAVHSPRRIVGGELVHRRPLCRAAGNRPAASAAAPEAMLPRLVDRVAAKLPGPDADTVRRVFNAHAAEIRQRSEAVGRAHNHVRDALDAEPFEQNALVAALDEVRDREQELHAAVQQTLLDAAPKLSPEARHKLAGWTPMDH